MKKNLSWGLVIIFLAGLLSSCDSLKSLSIQGSSTTPKATVLDYSDAEAANLLTNLVLGNYDEFKKDFSNSLKYSKAEFISLQQKALPLGNYKNISLVRVTNESELIVLTYLCDFEHGSVTLVLNLEPVVPYLISDFTFPDL